MSFKFHIEVDGVQQAHADNLREARLVAKYVCAHYVGHISITAGGNSQSDPYRLVEVVR